MTGFGLLKNKIAIVTGGSQGLGLSTATYLAQNGAKIAIFDLDDEYTALKADELPGSGHLGIRCDVTDATERVKAIQVVLDTFGTIDVLVNNAGIQFHSGAQDMPEEQWLKVINVNLNAVMFMSRDVSRTMINNGQGSIINIGSIASFQAMPGRTVYTTTKTGILGLSRNLAIDWGPYNIRVNTVCPGYHDTPLLQKYIANGTLDPELIKSRIPMARMGLAEDIGKAVTFFASELSEYITGQSIMVDGGYTAYGGAGGLNGVED